MDILDSNQIGSVEITSPPLPFAPSWDQDDIAKLRDLVAAGKNALEISALMGRTYGAVRSKCRDLHIKILKVSMWTPWKERKLEELVSQKKSASQIGEVLNTSRCSVISKVHRMGLTLHFSPPRRSPVERAIRYRPPKPRKTKAPVSGFPSVSEEATELPPDQSEFKCSFEQLQPHHCRWPMGDPGSVDFGFCGARKFEGYSYCARHCRLAYTIPRRLPKQGTFRLERLWT